MLDQERLEEEDRSDAPYRHHPHKQDRVTHRRLLLHDYSALANDVRIRGTYERRRSRNVNAVSAARPAMPPLRTIGKGRLVASASGAPISVPATAATMLIAQARP